MVPPVIHFEDVEIDLARFEVRRAGRRVRLEKQPFDLLVLLVEKRGDLVLREEIAKSLWGPNVFIETDRSINNAVRKIRLALRDDPENPRFVETVAGRGYRFIAPVALPSARPSEAIRARTGKPVEAPSNEAFDLNHKSIGYRWAGVGVVLLLVIVVTGLWYRSFIKTRQGLAAIRSIAVLPLHSLSADPAQEYFADGMTDELTTELARIGALKVISVTSAMQYKGVRKPLPQIARELNVEAVLEGSVLRDGEHVRITAQLIAAANDQHLWADTYNRDLKDVLNLQREVAQAIAQQVRAQLSPDQETQLAARHQVDPAVHDLYFQGLYHYNKGAEKDLQDAIGYFQSAIAKEPNYAPAYAGIADSYTQLSTYYLRPTGAMPKAKAAALKALAIDDSLSEAHAALGFVDVTYAWAWEAGAKEARRAIELNPNNATAYDVEAIYFSAKGLHDQAIAAIQRAHQLDPYSIPIVADHIFLAFAARRYAEAIEVGRRAVEEEPNAAMFHTYLALPYAMQGRFQEAISEAETGHRLDNSPTLESFLAGVYALGGRKSDAGRLVDDLEQKHESQYSCSYEIADAYVALGQKDIAFRWFETAYRERSDCMFLLRQDPRLDGLRSDPRYQDLVHRVGL